MARINSISNASGSMTIDPGASGDSWVQFSINGTGEFRVGVDDNDGDAFKISQGSALGTNDTFVMSASGERTMPLQPSFLAAVNQEDNVTGDNTVHSIGSVTATTQVIDRNGDFTPGDGAGTGATFTAPVTGYYLLSQYLTLAFPPTGGDQWNTRFQASNRIMFGTLLPTQNQLTGFYGPNQWLHSADVTIMDMDASDTVTLNLQGGLDAKVDDVVGAGVFSGFLLQ